MSSSIFLSAHIPFHLILNIINVIIPIRSTDHLEEWCSAQTKTTRQGQGELTLRLVKVLRHFPHPEEEAELVGQLVRGWCAFQGAPEEVWKGMGDDRADVEEMRGSALEVSVVPLLNRPREGSSFIHLLRLNLHLQSWRTGQASVYRPERRSRADRVVGDRVKLKTFPIPPTYPAPRESDLRRPSHLHPQLF